MRDKMIEEISRYHDILREQINWECCSNSISEKESVYQDILDYEDNYYTDWTFDDLYKYIVYLEKLTQVQNSVGIIDWDSYARNSSLEDVYLDLCKNEPSNKKYKPYQVWSDLEGIIYEELQNEEERPKVCEELINQAVEFMKEQRYKLLKRNGVRFYDKYL